MTTTRTIALIAISMAFSSQVFARDLLTPHRAEYKVKISIVSGKLSTELRRTENGYVARHIVRPVGISRLLTRGSMDVTSRFASGPDGIVPISYKAINTIGKHPDVDLHFDWSTHEATGTIGDQEIVLQLDELAHDSVSIQYALMRDLMNGGAGSRYALFDVDNIRTANVTMIGNRQVTTYAGKFQAIGIQHHKEGSSRTTTLWCVEELDYLPVIIEQHRKGKLKFRATLLKYIPTDQASQE